MIIQLKRGLEISKIAYAKIQNPSDHNPKIYTNKKRMELIVTPFNHINFG